MSNNQMQYLNMSLVDDAVVADALPHLLTEWRMKKRWASLLGKPRQFHRTILANYLQHGCPPVVRGPDRTTVHDLQDRDLVVMDADKIAAAYPFSTEKTRHQVEIGGVQNYCVCAIDALGSGAMAERSARVRSLCASCGQDILVGIGDDGLSVVKCSHDAPMVWAGVVDIAGCAATTQCQSMLMFCDQHHLDDWAQKAREKPQGYSFTISQAVQAGAAIFQPFLAK